MYFKKREITINDVRESEIKKLIKKASRKRDFGEILARIGKAITLAFVLILFISGVLFLFAYSNIGNKSFFEYANDKHFYTFSDCKINKNIQCNYHQIRDKELTFQLKNSYTYTIFIVNASAKGCFSNKTIKLEKFEEFNISLVCLNQTISKGEFNIKYINQNSGLLHNAYGNYINYIEVTPIFKVVHDFFVFFEDIF